MNTPTYARLISTAQNNSYCLRSAMARIVVAAVLTMSAATSTVSVAEDTSPLAAPTIGDAAVRPGEDVCTLLASPSARAGLDWPHLDELLRACGLAEPEQPAPRPSGTSRARPLQRQGARGRGAILGNPRANFPDPLVDAMGHVDGHGRSQETQNETTIGVTDDAVCAAWNDDAFRACAGGFDDGAECEKTSDCRLCTNGGASCEVSGDCGTCVGGPTPGVACVVGAQDRCVPGLIDADDDTDCDEGDNSSVCVEGANAGNPCQVSSECPGGTCGRVCVGGVNDGHQCRTGSACPGGDCGSLEPVCRRCIGGANNGAACLVNSECPGGGCGRTCVGGTNAGATCTNPSACPGGDCAGGRCARTCDGGGNAGAPCVQNSECPGGSCPGCARTCIGGANANALCTEASQCPGGRCDAGNCEGQNTGFGRSPTGLVLGAWTDQGSVFEPTTAGRNRSMGDPVMATDDSGRFYLAHMADTNGDDEIDSIYVQVSTDQCMTFPNPGVVASGPPTEGLDKPWIAVDRSGGPSNGNVYVCWTDFTAGGARIRLAASPPAPGLAFAPAGGIVVAGPSAGFPGNNPNAHVQHCQVAVGPDGTVHVTWTDYVDGTTGSAPPPNIHQRSGPAGIPPVFGPTELVRGVVVRPGGVDPRCRRLAIPGLVAGARNIRDREISTLAVNPISGVPYVAWNEGNTTAVRFCTGGPNDSAPCTANSECPGTGATCATAAESDVLFSQRSGPLRCLGGAQAGAACTGCNECPGGSCEPTWTDPTAVHPKPFDQFMPAMTVSPLGVIKIEYYDRANQPPGYIVLSDAVSIDGNTWVNEQVSTTAFTLDAFVPSSNCYMGDYNGIAADDIGFYHVWGDNRESRSGCGGGANNGAPCTAASECPGGACHTPDHLDPNVFFDFQPTLRHFECDEVERESFTIIPNLPLDDEFGPSDVDVIRPKRLCNPANKNGEDKLAPFDPDHLAGYIIKQRVPRFHRIPDQVVENQFGTIIVDLVRPDYLMVPTAKSLSGPPLPLLDPRIDHYKCYKVSGARTRVPLVQIQDQFGTFTMDVKRPMRLCVAANKAFEGILDPPVPMMCYKVVPSHGFPPFVGPIGPVYVDNQFGADVFEVNHARELCVPSALNPEFPQCTP